MDNELCIYINTAFLAVNFILLLPAVVFDKKHKATPYYSLFYIFLVIWQLLEMHTFIVPDTTTIRYLYDIKLVFVGLVALDFCMMTLHYFGLGKKITRGTLALMCIVPAITAVLAVTTTLHPLLRENFVVEQISPALHVTNTHGVWFYINAAYCQGLILVSMVVTFVRMDKLSGVVRASAYWILASIFIYVGGVVFEFVKPAYILVDMNLAGATLGGLLFHIAHAVNRSTNSLYFERKALSNYLDDAVFLLNGNQQVIDRNITAGKWLDALGITTEKRDFFEILHEYEQKEILTAKPSPAGSGLDLLLIATEYPVIYHMSQMDILDETKECIGQTVTLKNVTRNRIALERLSDLAGTDKLTGLHNRYRYQELLRELNEPEFLPFSIVVGDINGLKAINDTLGHAHGDKVLQQVAGILESCCPPNGYATRIGGDEFALLLPNCSENDAKALIQTIREALTKEMKDTSPVIALGHATRTSMSANLNLLINEADENMYVDKG